MGIGDSESVTWEDIELSESYLICSMFEEAASLACSILKILCGSHDIGNEAGDDIQLFDMLESSGMVFVQAMKELGRTSEILNELMQFFFSAAAVPARVVLIGACFQMSEATSCGVREFLEEFLSKWSLANDRYYVLVGTRANIDRVERCDEHFVLGVDKYIEVVEIYVMKVLGTALDDMDLAISWVEKAELPEDKRQGLLRRLSSLHSIKVTNSSQGSLSPLLGDNHEFHSSNLKKSNMPKGSPLGLKDNYSLNGDTNMNQVAQRISKKMEPCLLWFRAITLKFCNTRLVISNGKVLLGCLILLVYIVLQRKQSTFKRSGILYRSTHVTQEYALNEPKHTDCQETSFVPQKCCSRLVEAFIFISSEPFSCCWSTFPGWVANKLELKLIPKLLKYML